MGELALSDPLALHVLCRFGQVMASALVQNIEGVNYRPSFKLSFVVVRLIDPESHHIGSFLDKDDIVDLLHNLSDLLLSWDSPYFKHVEYGNDEVGVIFVFECVEGVFQMTELDLGALLHTCFQIQVVSPYHLKLFVGSLAEAKVTTLLMQRKEFSELG